MIAFDTPGASNAANPRTDDRCNAASSNRPSNTGGSLTSRASTNASSARLRLAKPSDVSCNCLLKSSNAAWLPNLSERESVNSRTSALGLLAKRLATAAQPFGSGTSRCPFNAAAMPFKISS